VSWGGQVLYTSFHILPPQIIIMEKTTKLEKIELVALTIIFIVVSFVLGYWILTII